MVQSLTAHIFDQLEWTPGQRIREFTPERSKKGLKYRKLPGGRIVSIRGHVSHQQVYQALAAQLCLPFVPDTRYLPEIIDKNIALCLSNEEIVKYQIIPVRHQPGRLTILTADPNKQTTFDFLQNRFGDDDVKQIVVTDKDISRLSEELFRLNLLNTSIYKLIERNPAESATRAFSWKQIIFAGVSLVTTAVRGYFHLYRASSRS